METLDDNLWPTPYGNNPPNEWLHSFHEELSPDVPTIIDQDGRFSIISHEFGVEHVARPGVSAMPSPSGNKAFHQGITITADGNPVKTGNISYGVGHAPNDVPMHLRRDIEEGKTGSPERVKLVGRCVETDKFAAVCGYVVPGTTKDEVAAMLRTPLSGTWARYNGKTDYYGPVFVDRPGYLRGMNTGSDESSISDRLKKVAKKYFSVENKQGDVVFACSGVLADNLIYGSEKNMSGMDDVAKIVGEAIIKDYMIGGGEKVSVVANDQPDTASTGLAGEDSSKLNELISRFDTHMEEFRMLQSAVVRMQSESEDAIDLADSLPEIA